MPKRVASSSALSLTEIATHYALSNWKQTGTHWEREPSKRPSQRRDELILPLVWLSRLLFH
jgi:hypothetical protein